MPPRTRARVEPDAAPAHVPSTSDLFVAYQALVGRRASYDAMLWQTPALGVTAQAFLLTLALGPGTGAASRLTAAALSLVLTLMTVQLMSKHRFHESLDSFLLEELEKQIGLHTALGALPHGLAAKRVTGGRSLPTSPWPRRFWDASSFTLWRYGLGLFGVASLGIIAVVLVQVLFL